VLRFDAPALFDALDRQRSARHLTWEQVAAEIGVNSATIKRTRDGGRMEVDGMLAMVSWLGVPVETFVRRSPR
jgi:hypothetical protein